MRFIDQVISQLAKLPGLGIKSSSRIAYYLMQADITQVQNLVQSIIALKKNLKSCSICGNFAETNPCDICTDAKRDKSIICVVEQAKDIQNIENSTEFNGLYHVLNGVISPINGVGPQDLRIKELMARVKGGNIKEVIMATNPTIEGDTTAVYISKMLHTHNIITTRLALGLPVGGDLEYADKLTISRAFKGRGRF
jgi:recombination protein RecR